MEENGIVREHGVEPASQREGKRASILYSSHELMGAQDLNPLKGKVEFTVTPRGALGRWKKGYNEDDSIVLPSELKGVNDGP